MMYTDPDCPCSWCEYCRAYYRQVQEAELARYRHDCHEPLRAAAHPPDSGLTVQAAWKRQLTDLEAAWEKQLIRPSRVIMPPLPDRPGYGSLAAAPERKRNLALVLPVCGMIVALAVISQLLWYFH